MQHEGTLWLREEGYVPIGKVGLVCGQQFFNSKSGVIRHWGTVLHTEDFSQDEAHITRYHGSHGGLTSGSKT